jgi:hypothetical protein
LLRAVMEVVRVVRDTRGDGVGVVARYVRLGMNVGVPFDDGTEGLRHVIATARTNTHAEMIVRALNNRAVDALGEAMHLVEEFEARIASEWGGPEDARIAPLRESLAALRGQSTAEEAFEQSSGGETLEEEWHG